MNFGILIYIDYISGYDIFKCNFNYFFYICSIII